MRVSKTPYGDVAAVIIIGNGPRDLRILATIATKYNHKKLLLHVQLPPPYSARKGLGAALEATYYVLTRCEACNHVLIVIDKEHLPVSEKLKKELLRHGIHAENIKKHESGLIEIDASLYMPGHQRKARILIAPQGHYKSIEENLAALIRLLYGEQVKPSKEDVNKWLRRHRLRDNELVEKADKDILEKAFPSLTHALKLLATHRDTHIHH